MSPKCLLSIVVPNYNHAPFLATAIKSILEQDFKDFELILIDNASTDNSLEVIHSFCQDSRIKLIQHATNLGIYASLNEGVSLARGEYIHFLNADDYYRPGFLSSCIELLLQYPEVGVCACDIYSFVDSSAELNLIHFLPEVHEPQVFSPQSLARAFQTTSLRLGGRNTLLKTSLLREQKGFDSNFSVACDWYAFTKIALKQGLIYIPKPFICWRCTPTCLTEQSLKSKHLKKQLYSNLLEDLSQTDPKFFHLFKLSAELGCVLKYAPLEMLKRPKYWSFIPYILKRFFKRRLLQNSTK